MRVFHGSAIEGRYHSDNIARVADDLIQECKIENDYFDITDIEYSVPTYWDIAKV